MNCRPGDIAYVVSGKYHGMLVSILHAAPQEVFRLPNGVWNDAGIPNDWVVQLLGGKVRPPGCSYETDIGATNDRRLRPIRGAKGDDETLKWAGKPAPVYIPAPDWVTR